MKKLKIDNTVQFEIIKREKGGIETYILKKYSDLRYCASVRHAAGASCCLLRKVQPMRCSFFMSSVTIA